jgi:adenine/guanine phosphoribosyltransferase-like PRPP-binding protein
MTKEGAGMNEQKKRLVILSAQYGSGPETDVDVTDVLNRLVRGDGLDVVVTDETMGTPPAKGQSKRLQIAYSIDNGPVRRTQVSENTQLKLR